MKNLLLLLILLSQSLTIPGQKNQPSWYSQYDYSGLTIRNSLPKGGPYKGKTEKHFNYSYLVFYTQLVNTNDRPVEVNIQFATDSIAIPNSPGVYQRLLLPTETMTPEKQSEFSYGLTDLGPMNQKNQLKKKLAPGEKYYFYTVALFFQTEPGKWIQDRGGNRAEYILKDDQLFFKMHPQIDLLPCGTIKEVGRL